MVGARMLGAARWIDRLEGAPAAGRRRPGSGRHAERRGSAYFSIAGQTWARRHGPPFARLGIPPRRSQIRVTSSISRQLIFWLAVPLMLLALCGALLHYFNSVAPGVINSDRRLKEAANALMARVLIKDGQVTLGTSTGAAGQPSLPAPDSIKYALRAPQGHLLIGDTQMPVVPMNTANAQLFAMAQIDDRSLRTLTTRFDTRSGVIIITVADVRTINDPDPRSGLLSTLLWDFVQMDVTLVLVWVGIQLG